MIEKTLYYTYSVRFKLSKEGRKYCFEVPNSLLEELAEYDPNEAHKPLDYGAVFDEHTEHFHEVAMLLISQKPEESSLIVITPENYYV